VSPAADVGAAPLAVRSAGSLLRGRVDAVALVEAALSP
jgi:hypothetical protein